MAADSVTARGPRYKGPMFVRRPPIATVLSAALVGVLLLLVAAPSHADEFKRCQELYAAKNYDGAYLCYKALWDAKKGPDVAANLGNVEVQIGKYKEAYLHLQYVLDTYPISDPKHPVVMQKTREKQAEAKAHVAVFKVSITPPGAAVAVNGVAIGTTPLSEPIVVDPGTHRLTATLDGYTALSQDLTAQPNTEQALNLAMKRANRGGGVSPAMIGVSIAGGVLALGALGAGIGLHVAAGGKADDREALAAEIGDNSTCSDPNNTDVRCDQIGSLADEENTFSAAGTAMLVVGGVLAAGTIVAIIVWPSASSSTEPASANLWIAPTPTGLLAGGTF